MFDFDLGELLRFMAFVTPPILVGTVLVRTVMHLWARWTGRKPRVSPWPVAMMLVMVLIPVIVAFCLSVYRLVAAPPMRLEALMVDVFLAAVLVAPILLIVGPILATQAVLSRFGKRFLPDGALYGAVVAAVVAEYFFIRSFH